MCAMKCYYAHGDALFMPISCSTHSRWWITFPQHLVIRSHSWQLQTSLGHRLAIIYTDVMIYRLKLRCSDCDNKHVIVARVSNGGSFQRDHLFTRQNTMGCLTVQCSAKWCTDHSRPLVLSFFGFHAMSVGFVNSVHIPYSYRCYILILCNRQLVKYIKHFTMKTIITRNSSANNNNTLFIMRLYS